jgi:hypothetical protein
MREKKNDCLQQVSTQPGWKKRHIRGDVFMIQQITKYVTEEAISSPRIKRLSRPSASIIRTNLCEYLVTQCDNDELGQLTRKSRSESVIHTRSTPPTNNSNSSRSSADRDVIVSTTTSGLRLSIRAFAASTRYKTIFLAHEPLHVGIARAGVWGKRKQKTKGLMAAVQT